MMMMKALELGSLFLGYALVGLGGEAAVALLGDQLDGGARADGAVEVRVDSRVEVASRVRLGSCGFEAERSAALSVGAADRLRIEAGSGELRVEGRAGLAEVRATGAACASSEAWLEELTITLERDGDEVVLSAHYPDRSGRRGWSGDQVARIDLVVEIPLGQRVDIEDSSGSLEVRGSGALRLGDSSGSITLAGIDGPVSVADGSGDVSIRDVAGEVEIRDGSGGIDLIGVEGSVSIRDGSGSIEVAEVGGDVVVEADGSGSIEVDDVAGDFTVDRDGSGGIRHSRVEGRVDVPRRERRRGG